MCLKMTGSRLHGKPIRRSLLGVVFLLLLGGSGGVAAQPDWFSTTGFPGVLATPTALMPAEGALGFGVSAADPYNTLYLSGQPFSWLNFNVRYTDITDRPYINSSYKDKAFDVAFRLIQPGSLFPAVSVGIVDIGGTGLFSSEYVVASQRIFNVYASLGLGWGRMGTQADLQNPLVSLSDTFRVRRGPDSNIAGKVSYKRWFRGEDAAVFGSLAWNPAGGPLTVIAELDGNAYTDEPSGQPIDASSRANFGLRYALSDYASATVSYIRGNTLSFQVGIHPLVGIDQPHSGSRYASELDRNRDASYRPPLARGEAERLAALYQALSYRGIFVHAIDLDEDRRTLTVWQSSRASADQLQILRNVGREASNTMPESVTTIRVVAMAGGAEAMQAEAPRAVIDEEASGLATIDDLIVQSQFGPGQVGRISEAGYPDLLRYPTYAFGVNPAVRSNIGGITRFYVGQLLLKPYMTLQLTPGLSLTATAGVSLYSDFEDLLVPKPTGTLPRVRSQLERYQMESGDVYLDELEANYLFPIASEWYGRVSAGIFEEMYGGVAAEVLYRPFDKRWAVSLDVNRVRQRDFDQRFDFLDYETTTGHLTVYYQTPWRGVDVAVSAGRYLARDVGVTLDLSRTFRNGARFGVFATRTDASAAEFGEGSFDKGFYVYIPLSVFSDGLKNGGTTVEYRFLARDGGQKVDDGRKLYGVYGDFNEGAIYGR